jgi:hypothetical protein
VCKYLLSELIGAPPAVHPDVRPKGALRSLKLKHICPEAIENQQKVITIHQQ